MKNSFFLLSYKVGIIDNSFVILVGKVVFLKIHSDVVAPQVLISLKCGLIPVCKIRWLFGNA